MKRLMVVIAASLTMLITAGGGPGWAAGPREQTAQITVQADTTTSSGATAAKTSGNDGADTGIQACVWTPDPGVGGVNVRTRPNTGAPRIGILQEGQGAFGSCEYTYSGYYNACGGVTNTWVYVYWGNTTGYMAAACLDGDEV